MPNTAHEAFWSEGTQYPLVRNQTRSSSVGCCQGRHTLPPGASLDADASGTIPPGDVARGEKTLKHLCWHSVELKARPALQHCIRRSETTSDETHTHAHNYEEKQSEGKIYPKRNLGRRKMLGKNMNTDPRLSRSRSRHRLVSSQDMVRGPGCVKSNIRMIYGPVMWDTKDACDTIRGQKTCGTRSDRWAADTSLMTYHSRC
jgi:hypothetical protein